MDLINAVNHLKNVAYNVLNPGLQYKKDPLDAYENEKNGTTIDRYPKPLSQSVHYIEKISDRDCKILNQILAQLKEELSLAQHRINEIQKFEDEISRI